MKEEYERAGVPMLPGVRGEAETRRQIVLYTLLLVAVTMLPFAGRLFDGVYAITALVLGVAFTWLAVMLQRSAERRAAPRLYLFSLAEPGGPVAAVVVDGSVLARSWRVEIPQRSVRVFGTHLPTDDGVLLQRGYSVT